VGATGGTARVAVGAGDAAGNGGIVAVGGTGVTATGGSGGVGVGVAANPEQAVRRRSGRSRNFFIADSCVVRNMLKCRNRINRLYRLA
jgi:hypothetical protein